MWHVHVRVQIGAPALCPVWRLNSKERRERLPPSHKDAHTGDDGRRSRKHQTNKNKLLNTNQAAHKCFKIFRVGEISIDPVTFIEQFLCSWHCAWSRTLK